VSTLVLGISRDAIRPIDAVAAFAERGLPLLGMHGEAESVVLFACAPSGLDVRLGHTCVLPGSEHLNA
jgi:hypothetical protein